MKKKVIILFALFAGAILALSIGNSYAAYKASADVTTSQIEFAKFVFEGNDVSTIPINLTGITPGSTIAYNFDVSNTNASNVKSDVSINYTISMSYTHNLPVTIKLYNITGTKELALDCTGTAVADGSAYTCQDTIKNIAYSNFTTHKYRIEITFPATNNGSTWDLSYAGMIDSLTVYLNSYQAPATSNDGTITSDVQICRRATTLHTENCTQTDMNNYCVAAGYTASGSKGTTTITYGSLGTTGTLTPGDAFDCDVNGDGTYDPTTERFYYVSDLSSNSNYAVLIYYNNVSSGSPSNTTTYAYDSSGENWHGPVTAMKQLPTTTQWSNVSLSNTSRTITYETGETSTGSGSYAIANPYNYAGFAARLLTTQEVESACGMTIGSSTVGELDSCTYLMENTKYSSTSLGSYGYWLETPDSSHSGSAWRVHSIRYLSTNNVESSGNRGVRPAIEVLKININY